MKALTSRELQIAYLIHQGYVEKEIASKLFLSPETVHTYKNYDLSKLELLSKTNDLYGRGDEEGGNPDMDVSPVTATTSGSTSKNGQVGIGRRSKNPEVRQALPTT